jgi:glutathione synthase/RimK-type ligase-like ATP-grasp enzyme
MAAAIVLVENRNDWRPHFPGAIIVTARDYLGQQEYHQLRDVRVINLCRSYGYLSLGYYCSLLAEARRHRVIPSVRTLTDLSRKAIYSLNMEDIEDLVTKSFKRQSPGGTRDNFTLTIFFGECGSRELQELARHIFDLFRCPLLRVEFRYQGNWTISSIRPAYLNSLPADDEPAFIQAFNNHLARRWQKPRTRDTARYDLAILYNPEEKLPPSNKRALQKFIAAGEKLGLNAELIEKKDYGRLAEYDALFIRETTGIDHYTYRFAKKGESEGMVVIDDPDSIVRCTNKVFLAELFLANKIPVPRTAILQKNDIKDLRGLLAGMAFPIVLKIPDGSFSRGIHKVEDARQLVEKSGLLFKESDLIIAQEFLYTEFDWRVGILNRVPLFACQYFMSKKHWQILKHSPSGRYASGDFKTWPVDRVPAEVINTALKGADLIGDGFYGVDVKQTDKGIVIMEINDNPNLDAGVEDAVAGDRLYHAIMAEFVRRLDELNK